MSAIADFTAANEKYVAGFGDKASLPLPPAKKLTVVTCMDARLDPGAFLGLVEGDAHVIRNAGGVAKEALRSIIISQQLLGTREVAVIHHTHCGMVTFTTPQLRARLKEEYPQGASEVEKIDFLEFSNIDESVRDDVAFLKGHPLLHEESTVKGYVYEVETGKIREIV